MYHVVNVVLIIKGKGTRDEAINAVFEKIGSALGKWFCEDVDELVPGEGYPEGSLLSYDVR